MATETGGGPPAGNTTAIVATGSVTPRTLANRAADVIRPRDYGAAADGTTNDSTAISLALADTTTEHPIVDGDGATYKINSAITVPAGMTLRNMRLVAGTAGMNMVLVGTGSSVLNVKLAGTATTSTVERGIYPSGDGVNDVTLDVEVASLTFGVHAQPTSSTTPLRWKGRVYAHDIVGTTGSSEGYGVLLSPASHCVLEVIAEDIKRHAVYLSAGSSFNDITVNIQTCGNGGVQIYSTNAQPTSKCNTIRGKIRGIYVPSGQAAGQSAGVYLLENVAQNTVTVDVDGEGTAEFAVVVEGSGSAGQAMPTGNHIRDCCVRGQFTGENVIKDLNGEATVIENNEIRAYSTNAVLALRRTGTPTLTMGPIAVGNYINAQGQAIKGIYDEVTAAATIVDRNEVQNNSTGVDFDDATGGLRKGGGLVRPEFVSTDRGDTSQTLTVGTDAQIQRWNTTLTASRTVTLSTTGAVNGDRFRIVRQAAGSYPLAVGTIWNLLWAGTWVEVAYDGSAWVVTGHGSI